MIGGFLNKILDALTGSAPAAPAPAQPSSIQPAPGPASAAVTRLARMDRHGSGFEVVGESYCQEALQEIAGPPRAEAKAFDCVAMLTPYDSNKYDSNAVKVTIGGLMVGHLSRADAVIFRDKLSKLGRAGQSVLAPARIVGGWHDRDGRGDYGVELKVSRKLEFQH